MAQKKILDSKEATAKFFSDSEIKEAEETLFTRPQEAEGEDLEEESKLTEEQKKQGVYINKVGRPRKHPVKRNYHFNLNLDEDLKQFLQFIAWKNRDSVTEYLNGLVRSEMETYLKDCKEKGVNPFEGWE